MKDNNTKELEGIIFGLLVFSFSNGWEKKKKSFARTWNVETRAEVINLSRNIKISSDDDNSNLFGAHMMITMGNF